MTLDLLAAALDFIAPAKPEAPARPAAFKVPRLGIDRPESPLNFDPYGSGTSSAWCERADITGNFCGGCIQMVAGK
jgi:hypothetical protein